MSAFCGSCGAPKTSSTAFCGSCGAAPAARSIGNSQADVRGVARESAEHGVGKVGARTLLLAAFCVVALLFAGLIVFGGEFGADQSEVGRRTGEIVISPKFGYVLPFSEDLAAARPSSGEAELFGFIERDGSFRIPPLFECPDQDDACLFRDGRALVSDGRGVRFVNNEGKYTSRRFACATAFSEGVASVAVGGEDCYDDKNRWGYISPQGSFVIAPQFKAAASFSDGLASVRVGTLYGFINRSGEYVINPRFMFAGKFSEGLAPVRSSESGERFDYVNKKGKVVIRRGFVEASDFSDGYAVVSVEDGKYGYIDKSGNFVIDPIYQRAGVFVRGLAPVCLAGDGDQRQCGVVGVNGNFVINPIYSEVRSFGDDGLAAVSIFDGESSRAGFIDSSGDEVVPLQFTEVQPFAEGLAAVNFGDDFDGEWGFVAS